MKKIRRFFKRFSRQLNRRRNRKPLMITAGVICALIVAAVGVFILTDFGFDPIPPPTGFIALGDSVSSGYGLSGYLQSPAGVHVNILYNSLLEAGYVDNFKNLAVSGFTTTNLLDLLHGLSDECVEYFNQARFVTINIGGNNILTPFIEYLSYLQVVYGAGNIATGAGGVLSGAWSIIYEIASGVGTIISDDDTTFDIGSMVTGFGAIISGFGDFISGAGDVIGGSPNVVGTWRGNLSPELESMLDEGIQNFHTEFIEIIQWLNEHAPRATIIVNTIYNPIPQDILRISVPISNWANELIVAMNDIIMHEGEANELLVVDVFSFFSQRLDLMRVNLNPLDGPLSIDIIHPNDEGHALLAGLQYAAFRRVYPAGSQ